MDDTSAGHAAAAPLITWTTLRRAGLIACALGASRQPHARLTPLDDGAARTATGSVGSGRHRDCGREDETIKQACRVTQGAGTADTRARCPATIAEDTIL